MNRQTLADVLQSTNQTGSYTLATVLEGAEAGSQLLLRDGDALWQTQSAELLQRQLAVLQACTATAFLHWKVSGYLLSALVRCRSWWSAAAVMLLLPL